MIIEVAVRDYLAGALTNIPVYAERPKSMTLPCVLIERTAGGTENFIKRATIAVQSYGKTLYEAIALDDRVVEAMQDTVTVDGISSVRHETSYNFTDEDTKRYRYQSVFELTYE